MHIFKLNTAASNSLDLTKVSRFSELFYSTDNDFSCLIS